MIGRLRRSYDHAGPLQYRGRDHSVAATTRIAAEIRPQKEYAGNRDNEGNDDGNQISALVVNGHAAESSRFQSVCFTGICFEFVSAVMLLEHDQSDPPHIKIFCSQDIFSEGRWVYRE
jgi:hypothetical protein